MMNIKQLATVLVVSIAATTSVFAMHSINDEAPHVAGSTYRTLIDRAASVKLNEDEYARFMNFVDSFPTKNLNHYDRSVKYDFGCHPQYLERQFFIEKKPIVYSYEFSSTEVNHDLSYGLDIVASISRKIVGSSS